TSSSPSSIAISAGSSKVVSSGGAKAITYSPYTNSGNCKDADTVASDLAKLSGYEIIRVYGTDCDTYGKVLSAIGSNQKLFAGIFHITDIQSQASLLIDAVKSSSRGWNAIYTVSIGNELVNNGAASTGQIKSAIDSVRSILSSAGYTGPVVSVDTLVAVKNNVALCEYSDYIAVNCHPFFDGKVKPSECGSWLKSQVNEVFEKCGSSKSVFIAETGWPHSGQSIGVSVPSSENQQTCIASIKETLGSSVTLFSQYNDYWKDPGPFGVEQAWGMFGD
ncbi:glycoside hydrolase family 17 protein, partial [Ascoidea rubescens DSM 1968]